MSERRTRDWLSLLGFEIVSARRYLFAPPWTQIHARGSPERWLEHRGPSIAPPLAGAYLLKARKRVHCVDADPPRVDPPARHRRRARRNRRSRIAA